MKSPNRPSFGPPGLCIASALLSACLAHAANTDLWNDYGNPYNHNFTSPPFWDGYADCPTYGGSTVELTASDIEQLNNNGGLFWHENQAIAYDAAFDVDSLGTYSSYWDENVWDTGTAFHTGTQVWIGGQLRTLGVTGWGSGTTAGGEFTLGGASTGPLFREAC